MVQRCKFALSVLPPYFSWFYWGTVRNLTWPKVLNIRQPQFWQTDHPSIVSELKRIQEWHLDACLLFDRKWGDSEKIKTISFCKLLSNSAPLPCCNKWEFSTPVTSEAGNSPQGQAVEQIAGGHEAVHHWIWLGLTAFKTQDAWCSRCKEHCHYLPQVEHGNLHCSKVVSLSKVLMSLLGQGKKARISWQTPVNSLCRHLTQGTQQNQTLRDGSPSSSHWYFRVFLPVE